MLQFYTYKLLRRPAAYFFKRIVIKRSRFCLDRANKKLHVDFVGVLGKFLGLTMVDLELLPPEIKRVLDIRQWYLARRLLYPRRNRFFNQISRPDVKVRLKTKAKSFKIFKEARIGAKILDLNLRWKLIYPCYFGIETQVFGKKNTEVPTIIKKDKGVQVFRGGRKEMRAVFFFLILRLLSYRSVFKRGRFSLVDLDEPMEWQKFIATRVTRREEAGGPEKLDRFYDEFYKQNYMSKYRKKKEFYLRFVDERTDEQKKQEAELKAWAKKYRRPIKSEDRPIEYMFSLDGLVKELWRLKIKKAANLIIFKQIYFRKLVKISSVWNVKLGNQFRKKLTGLYPVRYADTSINKFLTHNRIKRMKIFFLRKNRIFNKGRYSRSRQLYRTGVYMCIYINIAVVYGLYFIFYRFSFNFGYVWFIFALFVGSLIFSRILKYRFYNPRAILNEFFSFMVWMGYFIRVLICGLREFTGGAAMRHKHLIPHNVWAGRNSIGGEGVFAKLARRLFSVFLLRRSKKKSADVHFFFWKTMTGPDNSRFKWRSISYPFIQLVRCLMY